MSDVREDPVGFVDQRLGAARGISFLLDYVFPDHWSFLFGEIALYCFVVLVASGTYLALFFNPDITEITYHGVYAPLHGQSVSLAYASVLHIVFSVSGGLLARQVHHWAALIFVAAIVVHLMRITFTGAFRKPRDINYLIGLTLLALSILEGFAGYSLPGDLLSGMGLAIAWGVAMSIPLVGGPFATALWGGRFPGSSVFESRLFIAHVFIIPALLGALIAVHLAIIVTQRHSQFPGPQRREDNVVGTPMWPGYALRSTGLFFATAAVIVLLGGLVQINPVWLYGPYHPYVGTNGAQPDWYLGWLIGALRIMPKLEISFLGHTLVPNPFWGGVLFPGAIFGFLYLLPWLDRRFISQDARRHDLLERPRDNPTRTAILASVLAIVAVVFLAGASDRLYYQFDFGYEGDIWFFRAAFFVVPAAVYLFTRWACNELRRVEAHPLRAWTGSVVARNESGGVEQLDGGEIAPQQPSQAPGVASQPRAPAPP
ncbi:MAG: cytochrome bc1 complex cytochrome b subunit [Solirubrobacteraceae bacterium]